MQFFFVGLAMRSRAHDYGSIHTALFAMQARRVSIRIWLCVVKGDEVEARFAEIGRALAATDEMLVVEVPQALRGPRMVPIAA